MVEKLYEKELLISPLVKEDMTDTDIKDFADAIEKVICNIDQLQNYSETDEVKIFDPVAAIENNVNN